MGRTGMELMPREWTSGWHGRRWKEPPLGARDDLHFPWFTFTFPYFHSFVRGARSAHSAPPRVKDFFCSSAPAEGRAWFLLYFLGRISLRMDGDVS
jgi:hypothetical protein